MPPALVDRLNTVAEFLVAAGWDHFSQALLLAALLALIDFTLGRRIGPHWRCALWLLFFIKLALPPHLALPSSPAYWWSRIPTAEAAPPPVAMDAMTMSEPWAANAVPVTSVPPADAPAPAAGGVPAVSTPLSWALLVVMAWAVGVAVLTSVSTVQRRRLRAALRPTFSPSARLLAALDRACDEIDLRTPVRLRITDPGVGPVVIGVFRPTIHLPRTLAESFSPAELHAVLVHELLHVKRGDLWVVAIQSIARVLFFYHPAVWLVNAHLARLREEATDRAVLWHPQVDARAYSLALVAAAEFALGRRPAPFALGVIETKSQLKQRIQMNLSHPRTRRAHLGRSGLFSLALLGLLLLPMAPAGLADVMPAPPPGFQVADGHAVAQRIDAATQRIIAVFNRRDRDAYLAAFAPGAFVVPPGAPMLRGRIGAAETYMQAPTGLQYEGMQWKDRQILRIGRWVVETGMVGFQFRLTPEAPIMTDPRQAFSIWEETGDGSLQVKLLAWNPLYNPPTFGGAEPVTAFAAKDASVPFSTEGDFSAVLKAEETFHEAFEQKRPGDAADYYAREAILFIPETHPLRGNEAIRRHITAVPADRSPAKIERSVAHVEGNGSHVLVVNLFKWTFVPPGTNVPIPITGKGVHLWQRGADGTWKILFDLPNSSQRGSG